jgi:AcrR family transcriptional regulator
MDAALELATEGGYDAMQVRAITQRASVSSRTIYSYFPSLDSLLILAVAERAGVELFQHFTQASRKRTPAARVEQVVGELTAVMTSNRTLTSALLRALLSGKPDVAPHVANFSAITRTVFARAIAPDGPTPDDAVAAEILELVWFTALIGWSTQADASDEMPKIMERAIKRVLPT